MVGGGAPQFHVDFPRLRRDRLKRLQSSMASHDVGACLLTAPSRIRYATGTSVMPIWTAINLARYALVPAIGEPVLFEYSKSLFRAREVLPKSRPAIAWQQRFSQHEVDRISSRWAQEISGLLREWGVSSQKIATDCLDFNGFRALERTGAMLTDSDEVFEDAQHFKTEDEIALIRQSCWVAEIALADLQRAILPGISENELLATFWSSMQAKGGEHCSTRLLCAGARTNPWFNEAGAYRVESGDLVALDTDMVGPEGYLCDVSRTFLCGDRPSDLQTETYQVALDFIDATMPWVKPGIEFAELMEKGPMMSEPYRAQGYSCWIHGDGMDDEPPFLPFREEAAKGALVPRGRFEAGMVVSVEVYAGKVGARDGVKLEEQVLITEQGPERLCRFPIDRVLVGRNG